MSTSVNQVEDSDLKDLMKTLEAQIFAKVAEVQTKRKEECSAASEVHLLRALSSPTPVFIVRVRAFACLCLRVRAELIILLSMCTDR